MLISHFWFNRHQRWINRTKMMNKSEGAYVISETLSAVLGGGGVNRQHMILASENATRNSRRLKLALKPVKVQGKYLK